MNPQRYTHCFCLPHLFALCLYAACFAVQAQADYRLLVYAGPVDSSLLSVDLLARYEGLSNYVSQIVGKPVRTRVMKNPKQVSEALVLGGAAFDLAYVNAEMALEAIDNGWEALVERDEKVAAAFVVKHDASYQSISELLDKKIGMITHAIVTTIARFHLHQKGVRQYEEVKAEMRDPDYLMNALQNSSRVDAIALPLEWANLRIQKFQLDKKEPWFRILTRSEAVPGFVFLVRKKSLDAKKIQSLTEGMLKLDAKSEKHQALLSRLNDGSLAKSGFRAFAPEELEVLRAAIHFQAMNNLKR